jgi:hypothetical protein
MLACRHQSAATLLAGCCLPLHSNQKRANFGGAARFAVPPSAPYPLQLPLRLIIQPSQPELGTNAVSLRAPGRPLRGSMAFLGHLGLNIVQKSKENSWGLTLCSSR